MKAERGTEMIQERQNVVHTEEGLWQKGKTYGKSGTKHEREVR